MSNPEWMDSNQRLSRRLRSCQTELKKLKKLIRSCPRCKSRTRDFNLIYTPDWATGEQWKDWVWIKMQQSVFRMTKERAIYITEDGELICDSLGDLDPESISGLDFPSALTVANVLAMNDGGWYDPKDDASDVEKEGDSVRGGDG